MARAKGMTEEMHEEFMAVVLAAQKGNKIAMAYRVRSMPRSRRSDVSELKAPTWDANLYLKFVDARLRPALDLMGRLDPPMPRGRAMRSTTWAVAPAIYAPPGRALCRAAGHRRRFLRRDAGQGAQPDGRQACELHQGRPGAVQAGRTAGILYSNAAYQWVENHIDYFPGLLKVLPSGGQLAIQMPRNHEAPRTR